MNYWPCGQSSRPRSGDTPTRASAKATHCEANGIDCGASRILRPPRAGGTLAGGDLRRRRVARRAWKPPGQAGDDLLPQRLPAGEAVGPELDRFAVEAIRASLRERWPDATVAPLWVLGRALGVLVTTEPAAEPVAALAAAVAQIFELAGGFTDVVERGRRRKQPSAAAEIQLELLPPRIARVAGGRIVASPATARVAPPAAVARIERDVLSATGGEIRDDATQLLLAID